MFILQVDEMAGLRDSAERVGQSLNVRTSNERAHEKSIS